MQGGRQLLDHHNYLQGQYLNSFITAVEYDLKTWNMLFGQWVSARHWQDPDGWPRTGSHKVVISHTDCLSAQTEIMTLIFACDVVPLTNTRAPGKCMGVPVVRPSTSCPRLIFSNLRSFSIHNFTSLIHFTYLIHTHS